MPCQREEDNPENTAEAGNAQGCEGRPDEPPVHVSPGTWSERWRGKSLNVHEAENLTDHLKRLAAESVVLAAQVVE